MYFRSFVKFKVEPLMDYFNDVFTTFLGLECVSCIVYRVRKLSDFIKNILIYVKLMTSFSFLCELAL